MLSIKKLPILLFGASFLLNACSDTPEKTTGPKIIPDFELAACEDITDAHSDSLLQLAATNSVELLTTIGNGDFAAAQATSVTTKQLYKSVLDKYPNNCAAQLGYAVSIIGNLVNNEDVKTITSALQEEGSPQPNVMVLKTQEMPSILMKTSLLAKKESKEIISSDIQNAIVNAVLPSIDSAIIYMQNIVQAEAFQFTFTLNNADKDTLQLDRGEFAPALAALHLAKALLTMVASLDLQIEKNGTNSWIDSLSHLDITNAESSTSLKHLYSLLDPKSAFTTVRTEWKKAWQSIPSMLDSAIVNVQLGLEYGIKESKSATNTQEHDPYIVGDGEFADVSPANFQKAIDSLEFFRSALSGPITVSLNKTDSLVINFSKFFSITEGFQDFLPYHQFTDLDKWFAIDEKNSNWSDILDYDSYVEVDIQKTALKIGDDLFKDDLSYVYIDYNGGDGSYIAYIEGEVNGRYEEYEFNVIVEACTYQFIPFSNSDTEKYGTKYTFSPEYCKTEGKEVNYLFANGEIIPNVMNFTDKNGKITFSFSEFMSDKTTIDEYGDYEYTSWTIEDFKTRIIFPDPTFNGIFPNLTQESLWATIKILSGYSSEDEWQ